MASVASTAMTVRRASHGTRAEARIGAGFRHPGPARSVSIVVRGRVQGGGYRWFARDVAVAHGVSGWVRNRRDGSVEAELHGSEASVDAVLAALRQGPASARVEGLAVTDAAAADAAGFEIRPTD